MQYHKIKSIIGCLLGTAIGDAFGLRYEGLSKQRQNKLYPNPKNYNFIFNKGMISDDGGGDTDTTAAILGGIVGAAVGKDGIPQVWLDNLWEYPRNIKWIESLGSRLAESQQNTKHSALPISVYAVFLRNIFFLAIVIFHGFKRLFPPY